MVHIHLPNQLTEEEEMLQKKYAKLRKKKKALAALRAPKPEPPPPVVQSTKRSASEAAEEAKQQAKKLIASGQIKLAVEKKEHQGFKRSKRSKDTEKGSAPVGFQPFASTHGSDTEEEKPETERPAVKRLYDSFVSSHRESKPAPDVTRNETMGHDREPPKKGNTIYVHGHGVTEEILKKAFSHFGSIVNISTEREKHCGFVSFEKPESADEAISEMNGSVVSGVQLRVSMARRQPTFENNQDASTSSWSTIAANHSNKGAHKDKRDLVTYDDDDIF